MDGDGGMKLHNTHLCKCCLIYYGFGISNVYLSRLQPKTTWCPLEALTRGWQGLWRSPNPASHLTTSVLPESSSHFTPCSPHPSQLLCSDYFGLLQFLQHAKPMPTCLNALSLCSSHG